MSGLERATGGRFTVGSGDKATDRLFGKVHFGAAVVDQVAIADLVKLLFILSAPHFVEEASFGIDTESHKVEEFFQVIDVVTPCTFRKGSGLVEVFDILPDMGESWAEDCLAGEVLAELSKNPGVTDAGTADHEALASRIIEYADAFCDGGDVAIGEDGAG